MLAGRQRPGDVLGVHRGGQAHVDQVDGGVVVDAGHLGGGGIAELVGEGLQLGQGAAEDHDLADLGMGVVAAGVGDPEAGAQQADLHGALHVSQGSGGPAGMHHGLGIRQPRPPRQLSATHRSADVAPRHLRWATATTTRATRSQSQ